ncbi:hypothetical protein VNO77_23213 [Canavalia gladiata]|uniref:Uncharacterized protein n=1 Tax=Canavalia gladiata TaxID=3824 RepID=A0AAN9L7D6_CANGL
MRYTTLPKDSDSQYTIKEQKLECILYPGGATRDVNSSDRCWHRVPLWLTMTVMLEGTKWLPEASYVSHEYVPSMLPCIDLSWTASPYERLWVVCPLCLIQLRARGCMALTWPPLYDLVTLHRSLRRPSVTTISSREDGKRHLYKDPTPSKDMHATLELSTLWFNIRHESEPSMKFKSKPPDGSFLSLREPRMSPKNRAWTMLLLSSSEDPRAPFCSCLCFPQAPRNVLAPFFQEEVSPGKTKEEAGEEVPPLFAKKYEEKAREKPPSKPQ